MAGTHLCRTCRAMLTDADAARSPGVCPYCGAETGSAPESANPYAPPRFGPGEEVAPHEAIAGVPLTFPGKFALALRLFFGNIVLISALILTVWLPGNLLIGLVIGNDPDLDGNQPIRIAQLTNLIEAVFGPIYVGGILYVLANRMSGQSSSYVEAIRVGVHNWWRLFAARFIAGLFIIAGLIAFIVPGIILAIRYALLDPVVVLEGAGVSESRTRSTQLVRGKGIEIFVWGILYFCAVVTYSTLLTALLDFVPALNTIWFVAILRCTSNVLNTFTTVFIFTYFWEGHGRQPMIFGGEVETSRRDSFEDDL